MEKFISKRANDEDLTLAIFEQEPNVDDKTLRKIAKALIEKKDFDTFFYNKLHIKFPDLGREAIKIIEATYNFDIIDRRKLQNEYPNLEKEMAQKTVSKKEYYIFYENDLRKKYPELEEKIMHNIMNDHNYYDYFYFHLYRRFPQFLSDSGVVRYLKYNPSIVRDFDLQDYDEVPDELKYTPNNEPWVFGLFVHFVEKIAKIEQYFHYGIYDDPNELGTNVNKLLDYLLKGDFSWDNFLKIFNGAEIEVDENDTESVESAKIFKDMTEEIKEEFTNEQLDILKNNQLYYSNLATMDQSIKDELIKLKVWDGEERINLLDKAVKVYYSKNASLNHPISKRAETESDRRKRLIDEFGKLINKSKPVKPTETWWDKTKNWVSSFWDSSVKTPENAKNIKPGAQLTQTILDAWNIMSPYLPAGSTLTSGLRDFDEQKRILIEYWNAEIGKSLGERRNINTSYSRQDYLEMSRDLKRKGFDVSAPIDDISGHGDGKTFDISRADLDEINSIVIKMSNDPSFPVKFSNIRLEPNQCVEVKIKSIDFTKPQSIEETNKKLKELIEKYNKTSSHKTKLRVTNCAENKLSKRAIKIDKENITREQAENLANEYPESFFELELQKIFKDLSFTAAENLIKLSPRIFINLELYKTPEYQKFLIPFIKTLEKDDLLWFFKYDLDRVSAYAEIIKKKYPELFAFTAKEKEDDSKKSPEYMRVKSIAKNNPTKFFELDLHKIPEYKDIALIAAKDLADTFPYEFINLDLHKIPEYQDFLIPFVETLTEDNGDYIIENKLNEVEEYKKILEKKYPNMFFASSTRDFLNEKFESLGFGVIEDPPHPLVFVASKDIYFRACFLPGELLHGVEEMIGEGTFILFKIFCAIDINRADNKVKFNLWALSPNGKTKNLEDLSFLLSDKELSVISYLSNFIDVKEAVDLFDRWFKNFEETSAPDSNSKQSNNKSYSISKRAKTLGDFEEAQNYLYRRPISNKPTDIKNITPGALPQLTGITRDAWNLIMPYLPNGSFYSSGYRGYNEQKEILIDKWNKNIGDLTNQKNPKANYSPEDYTQMSEDLRKKEIYVSVPAKITSGHGDGQTFDIANEDKFSLVRIEQILKKLSSDPNFPVKFAEIFPEPNNRCVHVKVKSVEMPKNSEVKIKNISKLSSRVEEDIGLEKPKHKEPKEVIDEWFNEVNDLNPTVKEEQFKEIKPMELWHGVKDSKSLTQTETGWILTPNPKEPEEYRKLWFSPGWNSIGRDLAEAYADYALVKIQVPFEFSKTRAYKKDGQILEYTNSYKPIAPGFERSYQVQEWYLFNSSMHLTPNQIKFTKEEILHGDESFVKDNKISRRAIKINKENITLEQAENLSTHNPTTFFKLDLHKIPEYKDFALNAAKDLAQTFPYEFINLDLHKIPEYQDFLISFVESLTEDDKDFIIELSKIRKYRNIIDKKYPNKLFAPSIRDFLNERFESLGFDVIKDTQDSLVFAASKDVYICAVFLPSELIRGVEGTIDKDSFILVKMFCLVDIGMADKVEFSLWIESSNGAAKKLHELSFLLPEETTIISYLSNSINVREAMDLFEVLFGYFEKNLTSVFKVKQSNNRPHSLSKRANIKEKTNILYIVHPESIVEQNSMIWHVKPYLNKILSAIKSHNGPVIVSVHDRVFNKLQKNEELNEGEKYAINFLNELESSGAKIMHEGGEKNTLGVKACREYLDDIYLNNQMGSVIIGGCFISSNPNHYTMCVEDTKNTLAKEYGNENIKVDNSLVAMAGPVFYPTKDYSKNIKIKSISFPKEEMSDIKNRLNSGKNIYTTRISDEYERYSVGDICAVEGILLQVKNINKYYSIEDHPFFNSLSDEQITQISGNKFSVIELSLYSQEQNAKDKTGTCDPSQSLPIKRVSLRSILEKNAEEIKKLSDLVKSNAEEIKNADLSHPILIKTDGTIIDGFHRALKAKYYGLQNIAVKIIALNKTANIFPQIENIIDELKWELDLDDMEIIAKSNSEQNDAIKVYFEDPFKKAVVLYNENKIKNSPIKNIIKHELSNIIAARNDAKPGKEREWIEENMPYISKRAKVVSDKPAYKEKEKTDSGYIFRYDKKHLDKRWAEKRKKLQNLEKNIEKVRKQYEKDLTSDDLRTRATAAIVGIIDDTAMRIGNESSAKEAKTYGATTLEVKHLTISGNKSRFRFPGKDNVDQDVETTNSKITKVLKELIKGKKPNDFIFEIDGTKIWDRAVNRYLKQFGISAKDIRGFDANRLMKKTLKHKDWDEALKEVAETVGHEEATLKNQYLMPELVEKYEKKAEIKPLISKRAAEKTPERELEDAKYFAEHSPITFFKSPEYAKYEKIALIAAENLAKQQPAYYFTEKFWKNPEYEKFKLIAAENLLNNFPDTFFRWKFENIKEYTPLLAEYIKKHPEEFFDRGLWRKKELVLVGLPAAEHYARNKPQEFFDFFLNDVDEYKQFIPLATLDSGNKDIELYYFLKNKLEEVGFKIFDKDKDDDDDYNGEYEFNLIGKKIIGKEHINFKKNKYFMDKIKDKNIEHMNHPNNIIETDVSVEIDIKYGFPDLCNFKFYDSVNKYHFYQFIHRRIGMSDEGDTDIIMDWLDWYKDLKNNCSVKNIKSDCNFPISKRAHKKEFVIYEVKLGKNVRKLSSHAKFKDALEALKSYRAQGIDCDFEEEIINKPAPTFIEVARALEDPRTGLIFVANLIRALSNDLREGKKLVLDAAHKGIIELRPESGMGRLSAEDEVILPRTSMEPYIPLSWAKLVEKPISNRG